MPHPDRGTRNVLALVLAAGVAFLGGAILLKAGRAFPALAGAARGDVHPGILLLAVVVLLATTGALLLALAAKELAELRRHGRAR